MRMRIVGAVLLAMTLAVTAGCGLGQKAADKAADGLISALTGGAAGVSSDGTFTLKDGEGNQMTFGLQEGEVPANFVLPVYPGWKTDGIVTTNSNGHPGWIGTFYFKDDLQATAERYQKDLEALGLEVSAMAMEDEDGYTNLMFVGGSIKGKPHGGMITFSMDEDHGPSVSFMFSESDEDSNG